MCVFICFLKIIIIMRKENPSIDMGQNAQFSPLFGRAIQIGSDI